MTHSRVRLLLLSAALLLASTRARALEPAPASALDPPLEGDPANDPTRALAPEDDPDTQLPFSTLEARGVLSAAGELGILDPASGGSARRELAGGFAMQMVLGLKSWPFMLGLGGGVLRFADQTTSSPLVRTLSQDGALSVGATNLVRTTELRHAELVLRVEPWWGRVRPYAEGVFGVAALWNTAALHEAGGYGTRAHEEQRSVAILYGAALGVELRVLQLGTYRAAASELLLALGAKRLWTGLMERPEYAVTGETGLRAVARHSVLGIWLPFVTLSLSIDSRTAP